MYTNEISLSTARSRRNFLRTITTGAGFFWSSRLPLFAAQSDHGAAQFDIHRNAKPLLLEKKPLGSLGWQSFCFHSQNGHIFYLQQPPGASYRASSDHGDLLLGYLTADGGTDRDEPQMLLRGFGHGEALGVEPVGDETWIWMECSPLPWNEGYPMAFGTRICRFRWDSRAKGPFTLSDLGTSRMPGSTVYTLQPGSRVNMCSLDIPNGRLLLYYTTVAPGTKEYLQANLALYKLDDVKRNGDRAQPLYRQPMMKLQPDNDRNPGSTLQGITAWGDFAYLFSGEGKNGGSGVECATPTAQPSFLYRQSMITGEGIYARTNAGATMPYREPEGLAIQVIHGKPRLVMGLIGYAAGSQGCATNGRTGGTKFANLFYIDALANRTR